MHYQGGKYRFIKHITPIIQAEIDKHQARHFISPFCGACNIESAIVHTDKLCNDKNIYIIRMWQELQNGREFPSTVTEEQYKYVRDHKDEDPRIDRIHRSRFRTCGRMVSRLRKRQTRCELCGRCKTWQRTHNGRQDIPQFCS